MSRFEEMVKNAIAAGHQGGLTRAEKILSGSHDVRPVARGRIISKKNDLGMNKTEESYSVYLEALKHAGVIAAWWWDALTLKIGHDCRYRIDFLVQALDGELQIHETKGHMEDDALVKLKVCCASFPFRLFLVKKGNAAEPWTITEFKPW